MSQKFQLIVSFAQTQQRLRALMHPIHMPKGIGSFHAESQTYLKGIVRKASCCQIRRSSHRPQGLQVVASATAPSKGLLLIVTKSESEVKTHANTPKFAD